MAQQETAPLDMTPRARRWRLAVTAGRRTALTLFVISLAMPAWRLEGEQIAYGGFLAILGVLGPMAGVFAWFANPAFVIGYMLASHGRNRAAAVASFIAIMLAMQTFAVGELRFSSPQPQKVLQLLPGFYVWLGSCALLLAASLLGLRDGRPR